MGVHLRVILMQDPEPQGPQWRNDHGPHEHRSLQLCWYSAFWYLTRVPNAKRMVPVLGEKTTALLMDEMRLFAQNDRASMPSLHLLRVLWVHLHANGIHTPQPTTSHIITTVDLRRCAHAVSCALQQSTTATSRTRGFAHENTLRS